MSTLEKMKYKGKVKLKPQKNYMKCDINLSFNISSEISELTVLLHKGMSQKKAFMIGQFSGMVEPIAGVLGAVLAITMRNILPFTLSFAAGAMIYVVIEELIPESQMMETTKIATIGAMVGFTIMMLLDVALG